MTRLVYPDTLRLGEGNELTTADYLNMDIILLGGDILQCLHVYLDTQTVIIQVRPKGNRLNPRFVAVVTLGLLSAHWAGVSACTCVEAPPLHHYENSSIVFSGVVESATEYAFDKNLGHRPGRIEWIFRVGQVWKGPLFSKFNVLCEENPSSCWYGFEIGRHYIVYAVLVNADDKLYRTGLCSRLAPIEEAVWDRTVLRDPFIVDFRLYVPPPTENELTALVDRDNNKLARQARHALEALRESKSTVVDEQEQGAV